MRQRGIDVSTSVDLDLLSSPDAVQLEVADQQNRLLVTHDADFLRLAAGGNRHSGIAYCHRSKLSLGAIIRQLITWHDTLHPQDVQGKILFLSE